MPDTLPHIGAYVSIEKENLQRILDALRESGHELVGPTMGQGAIVYDHIEGVPDLPIGWTDKQEPGTYRLIRRDGGAYFGYVVGPHSWKKFLYPATQGLYGAQRRNGSFSVVVEAEERPRYAFIGVRACDLQAIKVHDHVFLERLHQEPHYKARRRNAFILGVNCVEPGGTCFCFSMRTGPKVGPGFDLALTELDEAFLVEVGSELGRQTMVNLAWRPAGAFELQAARQALADAERRMGRQMDVSDLPNFLYQNLEHPQWDRVGRRCLSCANCTQVCPTCFCSDIIEASDLMGRNTVRLRVWDSCFNPDFSHVHGGNIRPSIRSRYRQWLTHKLASWIDQFGHSGCVGCGRCITWCPAGIDITEEINAIRAEGRK
jgi:ferredoxin